MELVRRTDELPIVILELERKEKKNALNMALRDELERILVELEEDPRVKGVVLTGGPDFFSAGFDLKELVDRLQMRGIDLPILLRFNGILKDRLREINDAFANSIRDYGYKGRYKDKVPLNMHGLSPGFVMSVGWQFNRRWSTQVNVLGTAGLMWQLSMDMP